ncbi:MAG: hypothetical protein ABIA63_13160 [bacterium]
MTILKKSTVLALSAGLLILSSNCGQNPFGPGFSKGLRFFALFGKAMKKPEEEKNKDEAKQMATKAVNKLLAKSAGTDVALDQWTSREVGDSVHPDYPNRFIYLVEAEDKPDDRNPLKTQTGKGWVVYTKNHIGQIDSVFEWNFMGTENKTWKQEICSLKITIRFAKAAINEIEPGLTNLWGKNITPADQAGHKGFGDTAAFALDSLDAQTSVQYGEGHFYDAVSDEEDGASKSFDFLISLNHNHTYGDYEDNTARMSFTLERKDDAPIYFDIDFRGKADDDSTFGTLRENDSLGRVLVRFKKDKLDNGEYTIYDADGNPVTTETFGSTS